MKAAALLTDNEKLAILGNLLEQRMTIREEKTAAKKRRYIEKYKAAAARAASMQGMKEAVMRFEKIMNDEIPF